MKQTANGVTTEERTLRAAQHLNTLCVPKVSQSARGRRQINAILIDGYRRVRALFNVRVLNAANRDTRGAIT